jgi:hypothetical protein
LEPAGTSAFILSRKVRSDARSPARRWRSSAQSAPSRIPRAACTTGHRRHVPLVGQGNARRNRLAVEEGAGTPLPLRRMFEARKQVLAANESEPEAPSPAAPVQRRSRSRDGAPWHQRPPTPARRVLRGIHKSGKKLTIMGGLDTPPPGRHKRLRADESAPPLRSRTLDGTERKDSSAWRTSRCCNS